MSMTMEEHVENFSNDITIQGGTVGSESKKKQLFVKCARSPLTSLVDIFIGLLLALTGYPELERCENEAAYWLWVAGLAFIVTGFLNGMAYIASRLAVAQAYSGTENASRFMFLVGGWTSLLNFAILIWGTIVVCGKWSTWTYDPSDMEPNYCPYTPMMIAFIFIIIEWVYLPIVILVTVICFYLVVGFDACFPE